jgi:hypothetical protein
VYKLAAFSRRVRAAAITSLVAAFSGLGLLPIATYAGEDARERVDRSAVEHAPMRLWYTPVGAPWKGSKGQIQSQNWAGYLSPGQPPFTSVVGRWAVPSVAYVANSAASALWIGIASSAPSRTCRR